VVTTHPPSKCRYLPRGYSIQRLRWRPFSAQGAYLNYLGGDEGADGLKSAYGSKLARLAALKTKFDPGNLFRMNLNIAPASVAAA
jgi:Berberine and berberine like